MAAMFGFFLATLPLCSGNFQVNSGIEMRLPPIGVPGANVVNFTCLDRFDAHVATGFVELFII